MADESNNYLKLDTIDNNSNHSTNSDGDDDLDVPLSRLRLKSIDTVNRVMENTIPYPATNKLSVKEIFNERNEPRVELIKSHFHKEGRLQIDAALKIIHQATLLLNEEKNLLKVNAPVVIVGDIHGQYYDLLRLLEIGGSPSQNRYLFLGDYVDRGHFGIEIVLYLFALKILYPTNMNLLRGNHECRHLTDHFTFKRECQIKYSDSVYEACLDAFNSLPLAAVVNDQFLCVHGGLSPDIQTLHEFSVINRRREPPSSGPMCDLLWSDPSPNYDDSKTPYSVNLARGCSYYYNHEAVTKFLKNNQLLCLIRAHEAQDSGFRLFSRPKKSEFPSLITIFSAPNYLDIYNNKGAIIKYENNIFNTKQYTSVSHPYWLPNFMDVFSWSLPFIAEKVTEILLCIVELNIDNIVDKRERIRAKFIAIANLAILYSKIREKSETVVHLKGITPSSITHLKSLVNQPADNCLLGKELSKKRKLSIEEIKELDKVNECVPP